MEGASDIGVSVMCVSLVGEGVKDGAVPILPGDSPRGIVAVATARCPLSMATSVLFLPTMTSLCYP